MPLKVGFFVIKIVIALGLVLALLTLLFMTAPKTQIKIGTYKLQVQVADNPITQTQGLSGRASLPENDGMVFRFDTPALYNFWMRDMLFPLDFIWVSNNTIVGVKTRVEAPGPGASDASLQFISPPAPVDTIIEVNSGWVERHPVKAGDRITW